MARRPISVRNASQSSKPAAKGFTASHPVNNQTNETLLVQHITKRLDLSEQLRSPLVERFEFIDKEISGFVQLSEEDKRRARENKQKGTTKPTATQLQLTYTQLDELNTFFISVFAPDAGLFEVVTTKDKAEIASGFTRLLDQHAEKFQYVRELGKAMFNGTKYNLGGLMINWTEIRGPKISNDAGGVNTQIEKNAKIFAGNELKSIDMYNVLWDVSVNPIDVHSKGEYVAFVEMKTPFRLRKMEADGEIHNLKKVMDENDLIRGASKYFRQTPQIREGQIGADGSTAGGSVNWLQIFGQTQTQGSGVTVEELNYVGWINPKSFGLSTDNELQIWRITMLNNEFIVAAEHMTNAHAKLPAVFCMPIEDQIGLDQKALSEILMPLQNFGSFLLNTHITASRKNIWDLTIYDPTKINLNELGDEPAGRVPVLPSGFGTNISEAIWSANTKLDTKTTMSDLANVIELMQQILPTDILRQVADLQRATELQSAATIQAGHKRNYKFAKTINDQMMLPARDIMMFNILQFQESVELIDDDGNMQTVDPAQFRNENIELAVGTGLKGADRLIIIGILRDILNVVIQSQVAVQEIDILALLNYMTNIAGDKVDLRQFKRQPTQVPPNPDGTPGPQLPANAANATNGAVPQ